MHDEDGFLSAIRQTPADNIARLVYADWLDEQDDLLCKTKSDFIRLELRMAEAREKGSNRVRQRNRLQQLAARLEPAWLAVVSHPKLEVCRFRFQFECPKQWDQLAPTDAPKTRFCETCKKNVHYCDTTDEAEAHVTNGSCIALSVALVREAFLLRRPQPPRPRFLASPRLGRVLPRSLRPGTPRPAPQPVPPPPPPPPSDPPPSESDESLLGPGAQPPRPPRRQNGRTRNRNIQREDWDADE